MSDIVERLPKEAAMLREIAQSQARGIDWQVNLSASSMALIEAADTITRLRAELAEALRERTEARAEAANLRAENRALKSPL